MVSLRETMPTDPKTDVIVLDLVEAAKKHLHERGDYSSRVIENIESTWNQFLDYCEKNGLEVYHVKYIENFITGYNWRKVPFKPSSIRRRTANMKILGLFAVNGTWEKGKLYSRPELSEDFSSFIDAQDKYFEKYDYSDNTRSTVMQQTYDVLHYFESCGVTTMTGIGHSQITSYVMSLKGHAKSTLRCELSRLRVILHNAYLLEFTSEDKSSLVPAFNLGQPQSRVKIWNQDELNKVLETVDPTSPKGKRDAAFITIASELGMRSKEICDLKLSDFDWEACSVSFTQCKTGHANVLPINEKTGTAIINYLHVRPETDSEYLFVKMIPPYDKLKSFNSAFEKYVRRSGVTIPRDSHYGLHSQRATLITRLLEAGVSADDAFSFAGQSNRESLPNYARLDIEHLRECALSFVDGDLI